MLAVSTAQLVEAVSAESQGGQLLRYVPELYCTVVLDMVGGLRLKGVCGGTGLLKACEPANDG